MVAPFCYRKRCDDQNDQRRNEATRRSTLSDVHTPVVFLIDFRNTLDRNRYSSLDIYMIRRQLSMITFVHHLICRFEMPSITFSVK